MPKIAPKLQVEGFSKADTMYILATAVMQDKIAQDKL